MLKFESKVNFIDFIAPLDSLLLIGVDLLDLASGDLVWHVDYLQGYKHGAFYWHLATRRFG
jgi:hypothetical protein